MKNLILFAVLLSILGCQAPKDRSGDQPASPKANPNSNDPDVKTQVEPRVIVLDAEKLILTLNRRDLVNEVAKDNLAEQSIEKTFTYTNETESDVTLLINGYSQLVKSDCFTDTRPILKATTALGNGSPQTRVLDLKKPGKIATVKIAEALQLTITMTNPGQCKSLKYIFTVASRKIRSN